MALACGGCGREFLGMKAFDKHRQGPFRQASGTGEDRHCVDPATLGLELNAKGVWIRPLTARKRARLQALRTARAAEKPEKPKDGSPAVRPRKPAR